ncbi:MAG: beta-ketoacyl-[acyl-carrier-protein] synthase family protein [Syntrophales bacterium]|jgi:3-oxoacyl-[acyl-carrier-protein] synthase II|nr:beta-ketoacyl-[acyl-carrier-protein] synthase family protein [Syntrophales bacterium]MDD4339905.1 beta-ketoacyl-[acyl-carrier-protein] synthase family protein [Syntrophales bacterium]HOG06477.1 beta-ketoacyl-[acyl-carrier-protein] synthase family protein [Syntrophales bacterium]HOS77276.1 beta-ketoacyl-[acyl-carrier-protein] synthase family protein [Syntrophales bacterium]HQP29615.1 beta-ketoacyl-[acyl-carrier-protein] synthase family protein [Syntrophales bacterium]
MADLRPVILGYDCVSPLGTDLDRQWARAAAGESGVGILTRFPLRDGFPVRIAGQVPEMDVAPYPFLRPREMAHWTSPVFPHALLVVHRALKRAGVEITPETAPRTAVTFSSAIGGLDALIAADRTLTASGKLPQPFMNPNACINMVGGKVAIFTGATGPIASIITACATGSSSLILGAMFIAQGMADIALCGAVDFPLIEPIVAGFATMNGAYRPREGETPPSPGAASAPFSLGRRGFVVSEGAGCIVLASRAFARAHGLAFETELAGWAMTADAYHAVMPNRAQVARCIADSLRHAGLSPAAIDAVNAHAASTRIGDRVEADALKEVFGDQIPPVSANKSQLGHAMGATSAVESILAIEGLRRGVLLPTINHLPDPAIALDCVAEGARPLDQSVVLKNAFGFGGCNACLVFRRVT